MSVSLSRGGATQPDSFLSPTRITIARQRRGLSKAELARRLGLTPRRVSAYESDGAPRSKAPALSGVLGFPGGFFSQEGMADLTDAEVNFRAGRMATAVQRNSAKAAGSLAIEVAKWIDDRFSLPAMDLPDFSGHEPRLAARLLRETWGLGARPLPNLVQLAEFHGLRMFSLPAIAEEVDAFSVWHGSTPYIFLARRKTPERSRFDVAHELGHLVLHRAEKATAAQEREADIFASEFLIPRTSIIEFLPQNPTVDELMEFKTAYRVSAMAATYASHKAGRLSDWGYRQNCAELDRRGYRTGEPRGMPRHEGSRVFPQAFNRDSYSVRDAADELSLPVDEVHALTFSTAFRVVNGEGSEPVVNDAVAGGKRVELRVL